MLLNAENESVHITYNVGIYICYSSSSSSKTLYFRIYGVHIHKIIDIKWYSGKQRTYIQIHHTKTKVH